MSRTKEEAWRQYGQAVVQDPERARLGFIRYSIIIVLLGVLIGICFALAVTR